VQDKGGKMLLPVSFEKTDPCINLHRKIMIAKKSKFITTQDFKSKDKFGEKANFVIMGHPENSWNPFDKTKKKLANKLVDKIVNIIEDQ
jgi:hypothetical protein